MIVLQGANIARYFGSETLFENIQITIQHNSRIALVGRNGTGKSTLLKILTGLEEPDKGIVSRGKNISIAYMDQYSAVNSELTVYEEMLTVFEPVLKMIDQAQAAAEKLTDEKLMQDEATYQQALDDFDRLQELLKKHNAYGYESEIRMVLHGFQFFDNQYDQPISQLSGGQRTRLALAKILLEKKDVLVLDEPTNHLDIDTLTWLESYLPKYPGAVLIVSHDRYFLDAVTNETYEISQNQIEYYAGNYSFYLKEKAIRLETQMKAFDKQQAEIDKLEDYVARNLVRASTTKMAQSRRKQLQKMDRLHKPHTDEKAPRIRFATAEESGNVVLTVNDLAIGFDDIVLSSPINIDLRKQQAIAVVGPNGVGKSTLLKTLLKQIPALSGKIHYGTNVHIGYYDQELGNLKSKKDVLHELWDAHPTMMERDIRTILGSFLFTGSDVEKAVSSLSGGEKARLELAKLALDHDNFLVLDEPTNHLDIDSKEVLENALIEYDGTLLFVSHDRYFINRTATQVLEVSPTGSTLYLGDYNYYINKKREEEERLTAEQVGDEVTVLTEKIISQGRKSFEESKESQRTVRKIEREVAKIETELADLDEQIASIEQEMTLPENFQDSLRLQALDADLKTAQVKQIELMEQWEEKSLALEEY